MRRIALLLCCWAGLACADLTAPVSEQTPEKPSQQADSSASTAARPRAAPKHNPARNARQADRDKAADSTIEASHVLIAYAGAKRAGPTVTRSKAEAKKLAVAVMQRAKKGEDFGKLARALSDGPSAKNGGSLGRFDRKSMVKPFSDAAFSLKPGEISEVVETEFGYHVIRRDH